MADQDRKPAEKTDAGTESAPTEERFADQQFGATAARDQEKAERAEDPEQELLDTDEPGPGASGRSPRAGNKAEPA
jgi:hypothetical protein